MGYRSTPKPKPEIPQFLKETQAATDSLSCFYGLRTQPLGSSSKNTTSRYNFPSADKKQNRITNLEESFDLSSPSMNRQGCNVRASRATEITGRKRSSHWQQVDKKGRLPLRTEDPNHPVAIGTWNRIDSAVKPHEIKIPTPDSFYDIDFSTRPPTDIVIKMAHTVIGRSGKPVVQTPVNLTDKAEFPELTTAAKSSQQQFFPQPHTPVLQRKDEQHYSARISQTPEVSTLSTPPNQVINEVDPELNAAAVGTSRSPQDTSQGNLGPEVTSSDIPYLQPSATTKSSKPQQTVLSRWFQPIKAAQTEQTQEERPVVVSPVLNPVSSPAEANQRYLVTEGAAFLAQVSKHTGYSNAKITSSADNLEMKPTSPLPAQTSIVESSVATNEEQQPQQQVDRSGVPNSTSAVDEVIAGIKAKLVLPVNASMNSSNKSVRGRADKDLSTISADLDFEDAFKGRNASARSENSVVVYGGRRPDGPYQVGEDYTNDYEPGQLRGWDGKWAPAPVEWDLRDMFDYRKPQHQDAIKNFVIDRYRAFKKGLCPALKIDEEQFTSGDSLAIGMTHFGKPIDPSNHFHMAARDPFTLNHLHQTAARSTETYNRSHSRLFPDKERKRQKKPTESEQKAMQEALEEMMRDLPPNKFKPMANIYVRPARVYDLPQIRNIHNYWTRVSAVTAERIEMTDREWRGRYDDCLIERYPFIVAILRHRRAGQKREKVVGFAYAEDFGGEQSMWRHTCELQLYVDPHHLRQGIGKNLMDFTLRGLDPSYVYHDAVEFIYTQDEMSRHESGGARSLTHIIISFPYVAAEEEQSRWIWDWLARVFGFELQGKLKGIGRKADSNKP